MADLRVVIETVPMPENDCVLEKLLLVEIESINSVEEMLHTVGRVEMEGALVLVESSKGAGVQPLLDMEVEGREDIGRGTYLLRRKNRFL